MTKDALGQVIIESTDTMYRISKTILVKDEDCQDAISEAIVKAYSKFHTLRYEEYVKTWLIRILINECYSLLKMNKRVVSINDYEETLEGSQKEDYSDLYQAVMSLPEKLRIAVVLHYLEGYSVKETSTMLKVSETAVKKRLFRARQELRISLEEDGQYEYQLQ